MLMVLVHRAALELEVHGHVVTGRQPARDSVLRYGGTGDRSDQTLSTNTPLDLSMKKPTAAASRSSIVASAGNAQVEPLDLSKPATLRPVPHQRDSSISRSRAVTSSASAPSTNRHQNSTLAHQRPHHSVHPIPIGSSPVSF